MMHDFLKFKAENAGKIDLRCISYFNTISKLQKRIKRFLARRWLKYSIMNYQWTMYEKQLIKIKGIEKNHHSLEENKEYDLEVRKMYLREYLRWQRIRYQKEYKQWERD